MTTFTPEPIVIRTALDEHGSLLDLPRIAGEDLKEYSERLFDTYANRASSTYSGLLNGMDRELGLDRQDLIDISIRSVGLGDLTDPAITITPITIINTSTFTNTINGTTVTAVGAKLTDTTQSWTPGHLRGYILKILAINYEVIDNTATELIVNADFSALTGNPYTVEVDWEVNSLTGLGIKIGNKLFKITENTNNTLKIDQGDLTEGDDTVYKIRAFNPRVEITGSFFNLYKEFSNSDNFQLEKGMDLREDVRFHKDIIAEINKLKFFEATNLQDIREDIFAFTINRQTSDESIIKEIIPAAKFFRLKNKNIKEDSVKFTEANIFLREVIEEDVSKLPGNYNIDYDQGIVKVNTTPSGNKPASYVWNDFPFTVVNSPVIINAFNKEDSEEFLFLQQEMKRYLTLKDQFRSSVPKADMIEYMAELLSVKPENWGE